jgi:hypothetical protein
MALKSPLDQNVWPLALCLEAPTHENHTVKDPGCVGDPDTSQLMDSSVY